MAPTHVAADGGHHPAHSGSAETAKKVGFFPSYSWFPVNRRMFLLPKTSKISKLVALDKPPQAPTHLNSCVGWWPMVLEVGRHRSAGSRRPIISQATAALQIAVTPLWLALPFLVAWVLGADKATGKLTGSFWSDTGLVFFSLAAHGLGQVWGILEVLRRKPCRLRGFGCCLRCSFLRCHGWKRRGRILSWVEVV